MKKENKEKTHYEAFKRAFERIKKEHPIIQSYRQTDYKSFCAIVKKSLDEKSYIEAFCIADQYVKEIIKIFLNIPEEDQKPIYISKILTLLSYIYEPAKKFLSDYKKFNTIRDDLVHNITRGKKIKINKEENLENICNSTIEKANKFFEETLAIRLFSYFSYKKRNKFDYFKKEIESIANYAAFTTDHRQNTTQNALQEKILKKINKFLEKPWKIHNELN